MNKPLLAAICLGTTLGGSMLSLNAQAEIYKWKDANGVIRYSDIPPPANVQVESMNSKKAPPVAPAAPVVTDSKVKASAKTSDKPVELSEEKVKEAESIVKKKNCEMAKANLEALSQPGAYKLNDKGEQIPLDAATIATEKEQAKKDIQRNCN